MQSVSRGSRGRVPGAFGVTVSPGSGEVDICRPGSCRGKGSDAPEPARPRGRRSERTRSVLTPSQALAAGLGILKAFFKKNETVFLKFPIV